MVARLDSVERWTRWMDSGPHGKHGNLTVKWHEGMVAALTFRKLRSWMVSFCAMANQTGLYPFYTSKKIPWPSDADLFDEDFGLKWLDELPGRFSDLPDRYLDYMTNGGRIPVDRWLRCESIVEDMISFLRDMGVEFDEATVRRRGHDRPFRKKRMRYRRAPRAHWSEKTLTQLERSNPWWMEIQERIYRAP